MNQSAWMNLESSSLVHRYFCIKVSRPLECQAESEFSCHNSITGGRDSRARGGGGLGDMVRKELAGKHFLNFEPHHEKLRKRIISKKGHVNIGKVKVSKR